MPMPPLHLILLALLLCTLLSAWCLNADPETAETAEAPGSSDWWQHAVFYQICPRSFQDSNGDGDGDLNGITSRLGYLKDLGVDAIWLSPCFPSPQVDFGYDVADYRNIDPRFGTLQDFDRMVSEARKLGIRVFLDLVLNHTSEEHPWFKDSRSSKQSSKRDWYIWEDGKGPGLPPCNWISEFGGPAWTLDPATGQYYYHYFYPQQPDLNWRNPAVRKEMLDVTRWWYERGVAGFRLDAIDMIFEDPDLPDNPILPGKNAMGDPNMINLYNHKLKDVHGLLQDLRSVADPFGAVLIGETYAETSEEQKAYFGNGCNELQMPTGHILAMAKTFSAPEFRQRIDATESMKSWPVWVFGNHDLARALTRFGNGRDNDAIAKILAGLVLTLRGTPILYYGEELGMENNDPMRKEDVVDPIALIGWPNAKRRDGERTPMQWDPTPGGGFSTGKPWLPVPPSSATHNVATERADPDSVLNFYRRLLAQRKGNWALREGGYEDLTPSDPNLLCYLRACPHEAILVGLNLSGETRKLSLALPLMDWPASRTKVLFSSSHAAGIPATLAPYGLFIAGLARD